METIINAHPKEFFTAILVRNPVWWSTTQKLKHLLFLLSSREALPDFTKKKLFGVNAATDWTLKICCVQ